MSSTRVSLLNRLKAADNKDAWSEFVYIYAPILKEYCHRLKIPETDAPDLTQDFFVFLLHHMTTFRYVQGGSFRRFLWICFRNLARHWYRRNRGVGLGQLEPVSTDIPLMEEHEFQRVIMSRVMKLISQRFDEQVWRSFVELRLNGRSAREVEQMLGVPQANAWVYASRVAKTLRDELGGMLD